MKKVVAVGTLVLIGIGAYFVLQPGDDTNPAGDDGTPSARGVARGSAEPVVDSRRGAIGADADTKRETDGAVRHASVREFDANRSAPGENATSGIKQNRPGHGDDDKADRDNPSSAPQLTSQEEQVMVMYDQMADALEEAPENCKAMSEAVGALIEENSAAIEEWKRSQAKLDDDLLAASRTRVEQAASTRLSRLRQNLRVSLANCKGDESLMAALGKLAALNE